MENPDGRARRSRRTALEVKLAAKQVLTNAHRLPIVRISLTKVKLERDPRFENSLRFGLFPNKPIVHKPFEIRVNRYVNKKAVPWLNVKLVDLPE